MAGGKIIKKRIASVINTRKITRTMEMVSTAKSKKLVDRVHASQPYANKLNEVMASLASLAAAGGASESRFLENIEDPQKIALVVVTANRGLCGGYNTNNLKLARAHYEVLTSQDKEVDLYVIGKKGISYFNFIGYPVVKTWTDIDDTFQYDQAEKIALFLMNHFSERKYDRIEVSSMIYHSSGSQLPDITQYLPMKMIVAENSSEGSSQGNHNENSGLIDYDPDPSVIIEKMLPLALKTGFYKLLLEAVTSEQIYRRIAMKNATDAAGDMLKDLKRTYNRARQASITQELSEIVAGADAL